MIKFQRFVTLFACLLLIPMFCWAGEPAKYDQSGFYAGVGGLYAIENFDANGIDIDNAPGFNFRVGYRLTSHWAVEAMGERVDDFDFRVSGVNGSVDTWTGTLNGKFFFLTDRFQPYGLFGLGFMRGHVRASSAFGSASATETDLALRFGGGVDSYITEHWLINTEVSYVLPTGDIDDIDYVSLGLGIQYRF
ncbi:MAG: outer membrane beta-barrel protein [Nitrospirales bacterium]|nr:outer membrane beta-barrel protein [Nitrospirales bacterium]